MLTLEIISKEKCHTEIIAKGIMRETISICCDLKSAFVYFSCRIKEFQKIIWNSYTAEIDEKENKLIVEFHSKHNKNIRIVGIIKEY